MNAQPVSALLAAVLLSPAAADPAASPAAADGCPSFIAVAAPYATVDGRPRAGSVTLLRGLRPAGLLHQGAGGLGDEPETNDSFGSALARGDFNGDGCDDLAIGASEEFHGAPTPGADGEGVVHLLYGTPHGLEPAGRIDVTLLGRRPGSDRFGAALAAGDFDGDGDDELAVGAPGAAGGGLVGIFGLGGRAPQAAGVPVGRAARWIGGRGEATGQFGAALAAGDFDGDGRDDLAIGAPGEGRRPGSGTVTVIDPVRRRATVHTQDGVGIPGVAEAWDAFGSALAAGDFNGDGRDDLAIGVPGEDLSAGRRAMEYGDGVVDVLYGSARGLTSGEAWSRRTLTGTPRHSDRFGAALAAGDLNGDGYDELIVGVPGAGAVQVIAGTGFGLSGRHDALITGGRTGGFGSSVLAVGRSILVGAPGESRVTVIETRPRKAGIAPGRARAAATGRPGDLFGYAMS
ncbi:FG-GAP repeat protein [Thermobispora bispora]|uniref:FG-GAP repeat protein n=1 Tax=Thermobispora bispora (strain ATCC 19993 / DSM 43833 / CBS 139.67 / JCM 10125 / KCTC 9307 / NBRC 14880 / R51) TaxID=469371 RepID=D6YBR1_THEBD|nr:FG-GAP repeat protein [Thermobispora bispora]ADG88621.1 FG-GAP repeat protein [Thermobispora bispora DSM 43833]MBO2475748.1 hypothetical protein [Actinomycetales bacterium]MDI9579184.1 FG-GAP repeat protein [Thermobispora sp.]QSI48407.1 hypothetical protein CYL17_11510 [Thermobispora bispora]